MSDRRTRPVVRCADPSCVHLGYFHGTRNRCPVHYRELVDRTAAAIDRRLNPPPTEPRDPLTEASHQLGGPT